MYVVWGRGQTSFFCMWVSSCSQRNFLKRLFVSLLHCPGTLGKNQLTENLRVYFWILNSVSLVCMSVFVPVPHCLDYHGFIIALKSESLNSLALLIFKSVWLFFINFRISLSIPAKKDSRTFDRDWVESGSI